MKLSALWGSDLEARPITENTIRMLETALGDTAPGELGSLGLDTPIYDLGLSSMAMLELVGHLEDRLQVQFPDDCLLELQTVGDLAQLIEQNVSQD